MKKMNTEKFLFVCSLAAFTIMVIVAAFVGTRIKHFLINKYDEGIIAMEQGNYEEALEIFEGMGNWRTAPDKVKEIRNILGYCTCGCKGCISCESED